MAKRNLNYVVGADISKAKRGFSELRDQMSRVGDCTKRLASLFSGAFGLLGLGAGVGGIKALGGAFVGAAQQMEDYRARLRSVIKDAGAADATFRRIYDWAAKNPVNTEEAIGAFVSLKAAAVKNAEQAIGAIGDVSAVMGRDMRDVAQAVIGAQTDSLRNLGIQLDQTGKDAVIQSGSVRIAVNKDIESIRAGILKVMQLNFGGAMADSADTFTGSLKIIDGLWSKFRTDVMGSSGSGGPFDSLKARIIGIRDEWTKWTEGKDYERFIGSVQHGIVFFAETVTTAFRLVGDNLGILSIGLKVLAAKMAFPGLLTLKKIWVELNEQLTRGMGLVPGATKLVSRLGAAFTMFSVTPGLINATSAALAALGLSPGGLAFAAIAGLVSLATTLDDSFERARSGISKFNAELRQVDTAKLQETLRASQGIMGGWRGSVELARREEEKRFSLPEKDEMSSGASGTPPAAPEVGLPVAGSKGPSAAARAVEEIRDRIRYLHEDGGRFLPILDAWAGKLKPLSDDWKLIADLQREITETATGRALDQGQLIHEAEVERLNRAKEAVEEIREISSWENRMGILPDEEYLAILQERFSALRREIGDLGSGIGDVAHWTPELRAAFEEVQNVAGSIAGDALSGLRERLSGGRISTDEFRLAVEALRDRFADLPGAVKSLDSTLESLGSSGKGALDDLWTKSQEWTKSLTDGMANAIVQGGSLLEVLQNIGRSFLQWGLSKWLGGIFKHGEGGAVQNERPLPLAKGGIVTRPTLFPMARGMGLMGEAGPEAVMPLKRGADGSLGVTAEGGGSVTNIFNISAVDAKSFADLVARNSGAIVAAVAGNYGDNGAMRKIIKGS